MKGRVRFVAICTGIAAIAVTACSIAPTTAATTLYDFGPTSGGGVLIATLITVRVQAPPWLNTTGIVYRLEYRDPARVASYRDSRWAASPAELLAERIRQQASRGSRAPHTAGLRVDVEEFCQAFSSPERSRAVVRARGALVDLTSGRVLRHRAFAVEVDAESADAAGGAHALARAAQQMTESLLSWVAAD
jgi:cholesterol transport system auxiliary component